MRSKHIIPLTATLLLSLPDRTLAQAGTKSPKRGLVQIHTDEHSADYQIWAAPDSGLSWYYNYGFHPTPDYNNTPLEFVPMFWGKQDGEGAMDFHDGVKALIDGGMDIKYVLGFNEPDGEKDTGGSAMSPEDAAKLWQEQVEPLKEDFPDLKLGAPAVTGSPRGIQWLDDWLSACDGGCTVDFLPLHWYGPVEYMLPFVNSTVERFKGNLTEEFWVTEFGIFNAELDVAKDFFRKGVEFLDGFDAVKRYSYFGTFRSDESNIGHNAAMLTKDGELTDIGSWYLGKEATGKVPEGLAGPAIGSFAGWTLVTAFVAFMMC